MESSPIRTGDAISPKRWIKKIETANPAARSWAGTTLAVTVLQGPSTAAISNMATKSRGSGRSPVGIDDGDHAERDGDEDGGGGEEQVGATGAAGQGVGRAGAEGDAEEAGQGGHAADPAAGDGRARAHERAGRRWPPRPRSRRVTKVTAARPGGVEEEGGVHEEGLVVGETRAGRSIGRVSCPSEAPSAGVANERGRRRPGARPGKPTTKKGDAPAVAGA